MLTISPHALQRFAMRRGIAALCRAGEQIRQELLMSEVVSFTTAQDLVPGRLWKNRHTRFLRTSDRKGIFVLERTIVLTYIDQVSIPRSRRAA